MPNALREVYKNEKIERYLHHSYLLFNRKSHKLVVSNCYIYQRKIINNEKVMILILCT